MTGLIRHLITSRQAGRRLRRWLSHADQRRTPVRPSWPRTSQAA
jgi:hypothetical protein